MKKLRLIWTIPVLLLLLVPLPVYADEGCDGDCDMEVNIGVSGNSEVDVFTGPNSEVGVYPGENNDVYINGQDINEPTVIVKNINKSSVNYSTYYSSRLSKLEYWRTETTDVIQMTMDGLAKLIMVSEDKNGELEILSQRLDTLLSEISEHDGDVIALQTVILTFNAEKDAEIANLKSQIELLGQKNSSQNIYLLWLLIGLVGGLAILGGLLYYRTRR